MRPPALLSVHLMPSPSIPASLPVLPPGGRPGGDTAEQRLRRVCQDFESIFLYKLLEQMRATVPQGGYLHSNQGDVYSAICDQQVAMALARSGGMGLAELLYQQLAAAKQTAAASGAHGGGAAPQGRPPAGPAGPAR